MQAYRSSSVMDKQKVTRRSFLRRAALAGGTALYMYANGRYKIALSSGPVVYKLRILHTNDHHSWVEPTNITLRDEPDPDIRRDFGGVARRKALLDQLKATAAADENVVLLDAGGRFAQVSGLRFIWATNLSAGRRILSVKVQSLSVAGGRARAGAVSAFTPIDPSATYHVITNNFVLGGGDGYDMFPQGQNKYDTGILLVDMLSEYLTANSPVSAAAEGRITGADQIYLPSVTHSLIPNRR